MTMEALQDMSHLVTGTPQPPKPLLVDLYLAGRERRVEESVG